jgi:putative membrane protein
MHYSHVVGEGCSILPMIFFVAMIFFLIIVFRRKRLSCGKEGSRRKWMSDWPGDRYKARTFESAVDILEKRYARGEISKEELEQMKKDIKSE